MIFFTAVAEYSDALKESIKSQTEYLAQASPNMSNVRTDDIFTNILMQHGRKPVKDHRVKRKNTFASTVKKVKSKLKALRKFSSQSMGNIQNLFLSLERQALVKRYFVKS